MATTPQQFPELTPEQLQEALQHVESHTTPAVTIGSQSFEFKPENTQQIQEALEAQRRAEETRYNELKSQVEQLARARETQPTPTTSAAPAAPVFAPAPAAKPKDDDEELSPEELLVRQFMQKEIKKILGVDDPRATLAALAQGTTLSFAASQKLYEQQQKQQEEFQKQLASQARAQAAWAFASSHPEFESTVENMKALDEILDQHKMPVSKESFEFAFWKAQQAGKVKPKQQQQQGTQFGGNPGARPPALPTIGGLGTSGAAGAANSRLLDRVTDLSATQIEQLSKQLGIPLGVDFQ